MALCAAAPAQSEEDWPKTLRLRSDEVNRGENLARALWDLTRSADAKDTTVQHWRCVIAFGLSRFSGQPLPDEGGAPSSTVPERLALARIGLGAARAVGGEVLADALLRFGEAALAEWRIDEARDAFREVAEADAGGYSCMGWLRLGSIEQHRGRLTRAREFYERARAVSLPDDATSKRARASIDGSWAEFQVVLGTTDEAVAPAVAEEEALGPREFAVVKREINFLTACERFEAALARADRALAAPNPRWTRRDLDHLLLLRARAGVDIESERERARATLRTFWNSDVQEFAAAARVRSAIAALDAGDLDDARAALDHDNELFGLNLRLASLRARVRLALATPDPLPEVLERELDEVVDEQLREWDLIPPRAGGLGFLDSEHRREILGLLLAVRLRRHPDGIDRAFVDLLRFTDRGSFARRLGLPATTIDDVLRQLPPGGAAICWLPSSHQSHAFLVRDGRIHHAWAADDRTIRDLARRHLDLVRNPDSDPEAVRALGAELRDALLPPAIWDIVRERRELVVFGIDDWKGLCLEALPGAGQPYLGWSHAITHLPSAAIGRWLLDRATGSHADRVAGTWALTPSQDLQRRWGIAPLTVEGRAYDAVLGPLGRVETTSEPLGDARYQLVVAHGVFELDRERPAGIALADRVLWADEIEVGPAAPLVTLLVCGAGRAIGRRGEDGGSHLGAAYFAAGARSVLLSNESLELESSLALAAALHDELTAGEAIGTAEALRRARIRVGTQARFASPASHALLRVTGLGHERLSLPKAEPSRWPPWPWLGVPLVALVGLGLRRMRRRRSRSPTEA